MMAYPAAALAPVPAPALGRGPGGSAPPAPALYQLFIRPAGATFTLTPAPSDTVASLKRQVFGIRAACRSLSAEAPG